MLATTAPSQPPNKACVLLATEWRTIGASINEPTKGGEGRGGEGRGGERGRQRDGGRESVFFLNSCSTDLLWPSVAMAAGLFGLQSCEKETVEIWEHIIVIGRQSHEAPP